MKCLVPFQRRLAESFLERGRLSDRGQDQNEADDPSIALKALENISEV